MAMFSSTNVRNQQKLLREQGWLINTCHLWSKSELHRHFGQTYQILSAKRDFKHQDKTHDWTLANKCSVSNCCDFCTMYLLLLQTASICCHWKFYFFVRLLHYFVFINAAETFVCTLYDPCGSQGNLSFTCLVYVISMLLFAWNLCV